MSIESYIHSVLVADAAVAALVGSGTSAKVYFVILPQGATYPAISITKISGIRDNDLEGPTGFANPRIQVDCWAQTYTQLASLAAAVRKALSGHVGGDDGISVRSVILNNETDFYEDTPKAFRKSLDFLVWHNEATA